MKGTERPFRGAPVEVSLAGAVDCSKRAGISPDIIDGTEVWTSLLVSPFVMIASPFAARTSSARLLLSAVVFGGKCLANS